jgi:hypothetical protein
MIIEFPAILFKNEIDVGAITGIAALIATAISFGLTYNRNRKSEQIRVASDLWCKIETKMDEVYNKMEEYSKLDSQSEEAKKLRLEIYPNVSFAAFHADFLSFLIIEKEIRDKKVINYYIVEIITLYLLTKNIVYNYTSFEYILKFKDKYRKDFESVKPDIKLD